MRSMTDRLPAWLRLMRPEQWTKNAICMAGFFFAYWDPSQNLKGHGVAPLLTAIASVILFSLVSSGIYAFNDWKDRAQDAMHPVKRNRPVASGAVAPGAALVLSFALLAVGLGLAAAVSTSLLVVLVGYAAIQIPYTLFLKRVPILDVFVIAFGFVLRAAAGAAAVCVRISPWLLLCTFLLALFLALCKRRQEKVTRKEDQQRPSVKGYNVEFLDSLISISAASTIVSYSLYTLSPDTIDRFGTPLLGLTIPVVIFGIFRYMHLVHVSDEGERPERVLLGDATIIWTVVTYVAVAAAVFLMAG